MGQNGGIVQNGVDHQDPFQKRRLHRGRGLGFPRSKRADDQTYKIGRHLAGWIERLDDLEAIRAAQMKGAGQGDGIE